MAERTIIPALTLHQPWASLVALGAKWIETRSWSSRYRGPLAIHAAATIPSYLGLRRGDRASFGAWEVERDASGLLLRGPIDWPYRLPLGAVVATATLVDVVPMVAPLRGGDHGPNPDDSPPPTGALLLDGLDHHLWLWDGSTPSDVEDQRPFGDFAPGRYAWLLEPVAPLREPVPAKGRQQLWGWRRG